MIDDELGPPSVADDIEGQGAQPVPREFTIGPWIAIAIIIAALTANQAKYWNYSYTPPAGFYYVGLQLEGGGDGNGSYGSGIFNILTFDPPAAQTVDATRRDGDYGYPTHAELDYWAGTVGVKLIRVDYIPERLLTAPGGSWRTADSSNCAHMPCPSDISVLDDFVAYAATKGLTVLFDYHQNGAQHRDAGPVSALARPMAVAAT